ncbi:MAG: alpha-L-glutamate ligase-like protein [Rickettsiales bacterium]|nr:alpha-L-glutamate ligase-like protein [Rickettsiales bacterium]
MFPWSYKKNGIIGINARNLDFIFPENKRKLYPLVDDKLKTKRLAESAGIPTPELYGVIEFQNQAKQLEQLVAPHRSFVVKPSKGSGGGGIIVVDDIVESGFKKASGEIMSRGDMRYHLNNILSGMYAMGGQSDRVLLEYVVQFDPIFNDITFRGVPDLRIILYRGIPLMAMLRLPTRASDGKANLHKGGIGVGISMRDGITLHGVSGGKFMDNHPETSRSISGRQIPNWRKILEMASKLYDITGLGWLGADIVLDRTKGPMLLEANARPGLAIQVANREGLGTRFDKLKQFSGDWQNVEQRVEFSLTHF